MEGLVPDQILDCWGLVCPMPVRKTAQTLTELSAGQVLQVIATDDWFGPDLEAWLKEHPHRLLSLNQKNGEIHAYIQKMDYSVHPEPFDSAVRPEPSRRTNGFAQDRLVEG